MSGGRFLVSLKKIYRSKSILKIKTYLSKNIELTTITSSCSDEESISVEEFALSITLDDFDYIVISEVAVEVIRSYYDIYPIHY